MLSIADHDDSKLQRILFDYEYYSCYCMFSYEYYLSITHIPIPRLRSFTVNDQIH